MASITTAAPGAPAPAAPGLRVAPGARRGWARAGIAAGVIGLAAFVASTGGLAVPEEALADNAVLVEEIAGKGIYVWVFQALMSAAAVGLALFGEGLRRQLDEQEPVGSLTGITALLGTGLSA